MASLLDRTLQLSMLELLAEVYPASLHASHLRPEHTPERTLRFNLMVLRAHGLIQLRSTPLNSPSSAHPAGQLVSLTPRGLQVLQGDWAPTTDAAPLDRLLEDSRPPTLRHVQPPPLPGYREPDLRDTPGAALRNLALETASDLIQLVEAVVDTSSQWLRRRPRSGDTQPGEAPRSRGTDTRTP